MLVLIMSLFLFWELEPTYKLVSEKQKKTAEASRICQEHLQEHMGVGLKIVQYTLLYAGLEQTNILS